MNRNYCDPVVTEGHVCIRIYPVLNGLNVNEMRELWWEMMFWLSGQRINYTTYHTTEGRAQPEFLYMSPEDAVAFKLRYGI